MNKYHSIDLKWSLKSLIEHSKILKWILAKTLCNAIPRIRMSFDHLMWSDHCSNYPQNAHKTHLRGSATSTHGQSVTSARSAQPNNNLNFFQTNFCLLVFSYKRNAWFFERYAHDAIVIHAINFFVIVLDISSLIRS